ncbi:MAG: hypothetical protein P8Z38_11805 [Robiginitalea sp.]
MKSQKSIGLIVGISIAIGLLHFLLGPGYQGPFRLFMTGYLIDLLLPMDLYLLGQIALRKHFTVKTSRILAGLGTFSFGVLVEYLQYLGLDFLGNTFDLLDLFMYAFGIGMGLGLDIWVLDRWEKGFEESSVSDGNLQ